MTPSDAVVATSQHVRLAVVTCLMAFVPAVLGFQLFASHLGQTSREVVRAATCHDRTCTQSAAVRRTIAVLEDGGLSCRPEPALTDSVVLEWRSTEVAVVDFATALRASANSEGWVRSYCITPR